MIFKNDLHSSQGKSERIDWIIGFVKQDPAFIFVGKILPHFKQNR